MPSDPQTARREKAARDRYIAGLRADGALLRERSAALDDAMHVLLRWIHRSRLLARWPGGSGRAPRSSVDRPGRSWSATTRRIQRVLAEHAALADAARLARAAEHAAAEEA